jgi:hypothetical protein
VHISQAEAAVSQLVTAYVAEACRTARLPLDDDPAVHAVYPCAGEDEWCVVSLRSAGALPAERDALVDAVAAWTARRDKGEVTEVLQAAGIPAAPMNRAVDLLTDPQLSFRKLYRDMTHPLIGVPMPSETGPAPYTHIPPADMRPAPMPGEHTVEICRTVLGMTNEDIDRLLGGGAIFAQERRP